MLSLVIICFIWSKNSESLFMSGSLIKFEKLTRCFGVEVLFDWLLFDWRIVASPTSELPSTAAKSFSVTSSSSQSCGNSSEDISSPSQSRNLLPLTFAFYLISLDGIKLWITSFKVLTEFFDVNSFRKSIISNPISANSLSDTR